MLHKKKVNAIKCMLSTLVAGPIAFNILATQSEKANASIKGTASVVSRTVQRPSATNVRYRLTPQEKTLGGIGLSVSIVGAVGTAVGLGLTQSQYHQSETYDAYYEEREKYMQNLFNSWGVAMPEKYKNPIAKPESTPEVKPGFSIGTEG